MNENCFFTECWLNDRRGDHSCQLNGSYISCCWENIEKLLKDFKWSYPIPSGSCQRVQLRLDLLSVLNINFSQKIHATVNHRLGKLSQSEQRTTGTVKDTFPLYFTCSFQDYMGHLNGKWQMSQRNRAWLCQASLWQVVTEVGWWSADTEADGITLHPDTKRFWMNAWVCDSLCPWQPPLVFNSTLYNSLIISVKARLQH